MEQQTFQSLFSVDRLRFYNNNNPSRLILSLINLLCKIIAVAGTLITIFSDHWAKNSNRYAGYKNRCLVHLCTSINPDPTWLVDIICLLSIVNLLLELMNISIIVYFSSWVRKLDLFLASMLVVSCLINNCGIVFGIHIVSYVYQLPMGYAYYCFMFAIVFNFIDWACSLKRFISDWPEMISFNPAELFYYTNRETTIPENALVISLKLLPDD